MARSTLARHRTLGVTSRFAREGNDGGGGGGSADDKSGGGSDTKGGDSKGAGTGRDDTSDKGFPEGTPLEQMNGAQREAYWKHYARHHEARANSRADYDDVKAKAAKYDELQRSQQTPSEQAVSEAKDQGKREGARDAFAKAAAAVLKTSLTSRGKTAEQAQAVIDAANLTAFVTDDGIDTTKVDSFVDSIAAPVKGGGTPRPDRSQGPRGDNSASGVGAGRDLFAERHKPRQTAGVTTA